MLKFVGYYKNGGIIQRNEEFSVRGYADQKFTLTLRGGDYVFERECIPENGRFAVTLPPVNDVENTFVLSAESGGERAEAHLRFGDVYLMLGQSNMTYSLGSTENSEKWLNRAKTSDIAVLDIREKPFADVSEVTRPLYPLYDFERDFEWMTGKDADLEHVSAITVQTATLLSEKQKIPVGAVHASMGGLSVEAYIPREKLEADKEVLEFTKRVGRYNSLEDYNAAGGRNFTQLSGVWNDKISPLSGCKFKGAVWYLGESSCWDFEFAQMFFKEMKMVVSALRENFGRIPFVAVHIAPEYYPYGDGYGYEYINEALTKLEYAEEDIHVVPAYDIEPRWLIPTGELYFHPIHPVNKAPVSERIANVFTKEREYYPRISEVAYFAQKAVVTIKNAGPLKVGAEYVGFTLAGENGKYYPAKAVCRGEDKIEVSSVDVPAPKFITYAFMQYPEHCDVFSPDGAPLMPYRSVEEPVTEKYFFPPAFTKNGATVVYENNFGIQAGNCHKVSVWNSGEIYREGNVKIGSTGSAVVFEAYPTKESFGLFGASFEICLCGHKHFLDKFRYLNFDLRADGEADFLGLIVKRADGEIFRVALMNGETEADSVPVRKDYKTYAARLDRGICGDGSPKEFSEAERKNFVQTELSFRSGGKVKIYIKNLLFSDKNLSEKYDKEQNRGGILRADVQLPASNDIG